MHNSETIIHSDTTENNIRAIVASCASVSASVCILGEGRVSVCILNHNFRRNLGGRYFRCLSEASAHYKSTEMRNILDAVAA